MIRKALYVIGCAALLTSCGIYSNYERPDTLPVDSLYRDTTALYANLDADTVNFGTRPWREVFADPVLQDLIDSALVRNTDVRQAMLTVEQARLGYKVSKIAFAPGLSIDPTATVSNTVNDGIESSRTLSIPADASWQVDIFGSLRNSKKQALMNYYQTVAAEQATRTAIVANVATLYYTLQMLDEQLSITKSTLELWGKNIAAMEKMKLAGQTNEAAIAQVKATALETEASISELEKSIRETENTICSILHEQPHPVTRNPFGTYALPEDMSVGLPIQLLENRPDVKAAEMQLAYCVYGTNAARSAFYPSITLSGSVGWTTAGGLGVVNPQSWIVSAVGSLVQPLFQRGQLIANLKISKAQQESALIGFEQSLLDAGMEVSNALMAYQVAEDQAGLRVQEVAECDKASRLTNLLFQHISSTTFLETLTAEQTLLAANLALVNDQYNQLSAAITLYQALGGGKE